MSIQRMAAVAIAAVLLASCSVSQRSEIPAAQPGQIQKAPSQSAGAARASTDAWSGPLPSLPPQSRDLGSNGLFRNTHVMHGPHARAFIAACCPNDAPSGTGNMTYHGGYVGHQPNLAIINWGFTPSDTTKDPYGEANTLYNLALAAENTQSGTWMYTTTQYTGLSGSPPVSASAVFPAYVIQWSDTSSSPPSGYTEADVQAEVIKAANAISPGSNPYGNGWAYLVLTPHGVLASNFPNTFCAYHGNIQYTAYAVVPYNTDAGPYSQNPSWGECGQNMVNSGSAGNLDGATIVAGHELAELTTNLVPETSTAWEDSASDEIGDKCSWFALNNVTFPNGQTFAMQPLWSNSIGCVMGYSPANAKQTYTCSYRTLTGVGTCGTGTPSDWTYTVNGLVDSSHPTSITLTSMHIATNCANALSYQVSLLNPSGTTVYNSGTQNGASFNASYGASSATGSWKWVLHANDQHVSCAANIANSGTFYDNAEGSENVVP